MQDGVGPREGHATFKSSQQHVIHDAGDDYVGCRTTSRQHQRPGLGSSGEGHDRGDQQHNDQNNVALHGEKPEEVERVDRRARGRVEKCRQNRHRAQCRDR